MQIINQPIKLAVIKKMAQGKFGQLVKAVVDVNQEIMAVDADMHADEEQLLLENGSRQTDLWGINLYPEQFGQDNFIEFDSIINLRPTQNNLSRGVENESLKEKIRQIVIKLVQS